VQPILSILPILSSECHKTSEEEKTQKPETKAQRKNRELQEKIDRLSPDCRVLIAKIRRHAAELRENDPDRHSLLSSIEDAAERPERAVRVLDAAIQSYVPDGSLN